MKIQKNGTESPRGQTPMPQDARFYGFEAVVGESYPG
jgi:hypothetical protein